MPSILTALIIATLAHAETQPSDHIYVTRTHPHSGPTRLELSCPAAKDKSCEIRRTVNGSVVAEEKVERARSEPIFKEFLGSAPGTSDIEKNIGRFVQWDVAFGTRHVSGGIARSGKLARPVVSLEAELLALVRKR